MTNQTVSVDFTDCDTQGEVIFMSSLWHGRLFEVSPHTLLDTSSLTTDEKATLREACESNGVANIPAERFAEVSLDDEPGA